MGGCASGTGDANPVLPDENQQATTFTRVSEGRSLWGFYEIRVDTRTCEFEVLPAREAMMHLNILAWLEDGPCLNCFQLVSLLPSGNDTFFATIRLRHPFGNQIFTGFDVRGIAMFDGSGSFWTSGLTYSDSDQEDGEVLNPDGYTTLYNPTTAGHGMEGYVEGNLASYWPPDTTLNAWKLFVSDDAANTRNMFYAGDEVTVTYEISLPMFGPFVFAYAVDACWAPPETKPVTDPVNDFGIDANCPEPWKIETFEEPVGEGLTPLGGETVLNIDVYDRTGKDSHNDPVIEAPYIFMDLKTAEFSEDGDGFTRYEITLTNEMMIGTGYWPCLVRVEDNENAGSPDWMDISAYEICELRVSGPPEAKAGADPNPQTEGKQIHFFDDGSFDPDGGDIVLFEWDWEADGTYDETGPDAYHTWMTPGTYDVQLRVTDDEGYTDELGWPLEIEIFEEGIPVAPVDVTPDWLNFASGRVVTDGNYCYLAACNNGLQIFDVTNKSNPTWVHHVDTLVSATDVALYGNYAFVAGGKCGGVTVVDISDPLTAEAVDWIGLGTVSDIDIDGNYLYTIGENLGLSVIDISNPLSPLPVKNWQFPGMAYFAVDVVVENGYAYLCGRSDGLWVVDIDPVSETHKVAEISSFMCWASVVDVSGNFAYLADANDGFKVIDIDPPEEANVVKTIEGNCWANDLDIVGSHAYMPMEYGGFIAMNISDPLNPFEEGSIETPGTCGGSDILNGYAYIADGYGGLTIINLNTSTITGNIDTVGWSLDVGIYGGYAYVCDYSGGLTVVDVDPYDQAHIVEGLVSPNYAKAIDIEGSYAYVTTNGLSIYDIDPPGSLNEIITVPDVGSGDDVEVSGGYAYVAAEDEGVYIVDVEPPGSAHVVKFVEVTGAQWYDHRLAVSDGYVYLTREGYDFTVIDVDPPASAYVVTTVTTDKMMEGVDAAGGYLYMGAYADGLRIYDVSTPGSPELVNTLLYCYPDNLLVQGGYAYCCTGSLRIVDIDPPESAYVLSSSPIYNAYNIVVDGQYAYVAASGGGLRIVALW